MGMSKYACLLFGIQIDVNSPRISEFLEKSESDSEFEFYYGEGAKYAYLGKELRESGRWSDDVNFEVDFVALNDIKNDLCLHFNTFYHISVLPNDIKLWFFDYWS